MEVVKQIIGKEVIGSSGMVVGKVKDIEVNLGEVEAQFWAKAVFLKV